MPLVFTQVVSVLEGFEAILRVLIAHMWYLLSCLIDIIKNIQYGNIYGHWSINK